MSLAGRWLLAPYLLGAWINSRAMDARANRSLSRSATAC